jgi:hypothetical protein
VRRPHFKNNFSDVLVTAPDSCITPEGLVLDIRLPWYRSLPLSVVMPTELLLDGQPLPLDEAAIEHEGRCYPLADLPAQVHAWWFVQDSVKLRVPVAGPLQKPANPGPHEVTLTLNLYPPYIPMLTWVTRGSAMLRAA